MSALITFSRTLLARVSGFFRRDAMDRDFEQELRTHLEMAEEEKVRQGLNPAEAQRQARLELGGLTQLREAGRETRGLPWIDTFWLDIKLGLRMLRKSWGLTLIGGLAMAIVISVGAVVFAALDMTLWVELPLDEGDRVVAIQTWDERAHRRRPTKVIDFEQWRERLHSVEELGAFRTIERNLAAADGIGEPVEVAEMTASGFDLARVRPLLGRPILKEDQRADASPVMVIGFEVWRNMFDSDPTVVGRELALGGTVHTVIGVMPEGFAFPVNHRFWRPLELDPEGDLPGGGPEGTVFARLAPGRSLEGAQAEITTLGLLAVRDVPEGDQQLVPRVVPYTFAFTGDFEGGELRWVIRLVLILIGLLLVPPCANIAILVYARTITRQEEFTARYALGASRSRIVVQLFLEVLVLAAAAAGVAILFARFAVGRLETSLSQDLGAEAPFWMDFAISPRTVLFAAFLAVLAATIAGLLPAIRATGSKMQLGLQSLGSRTGLKLGATWTGLVVAQVGLSLAVLPTAVEIGWGTVRAGLLGPGFAADQFLTARLTMDGAPSSSEAGVDARAFLQSFRDLQAELIRKLQAEAGVQGVTVAEAVPNEARWTRVTVEGTPDMEASAGFLPDHLVRSLPVDDAFFDVYDLRLLAGRLFEPSDFARGATAVVVTRAFAERVLEQANPVGLRVRYALEDQGELTAPQSEPWYQIVGVVGDLFADSPQGSVYHPAAPGLLHPATLTLRVQADATGAADRLRELASGLDLRLRVDRVQTLDEIYRQHQTGNYVGASILAVSTLAVLLLSAAGMYALMSFTINQRRREIGIRTALGAQPRRVLVSIFRRAIVQLGVGAALGVFAAFLLGRYFPVVEMGGQEVPGVLAAAAAFMVLIGLLATAGPALRGLRVDPIEELREG